MKHTAAHYSAARAELALAGLPDAADALCEAWLQGSDAAEAWNGNVEDEDSGLDHGGHEAARHGCESPSEQVAFAEGWRATMRDRLAASAEAAE